MILLEFLFVSRYIPSENEPIRDYAKQQWCKFNRWCEIKHIVTTTVYYYSPLENMKTTMQQNNGFNQFFSNIVYKRSTFNVKVSLPDAAR